MWTFEFEFALGWSHEVTPLPVTGLRFVTSENEKDTSISFAVCSAKASVDNIYWEMCNQIKLTKYI